MATYGLTSYGLDIPNYSEWLAEYLEITKDTFGSDINLEDNSVLNKLIGVFAWQDMKIWNVLQAVASSQTIDGAEGIYLDEVFGRRGVFRKPATRASGYATITTDKNSDWSYVVSSGVSFTDNNSEVFSVTDSQQLNNRISAYTVQLSDLTQQSIVTYYIVNPETAASTSQAFTTSSGTLMDDLHSFFTNSLHAKDSDKIFVSNDTLYVGYNNKLEVIGLTSPTKIYASFNVGVKHSDIYIVANETGHKTVLPRSITNMSPTPPNGYVGVTNFLSFNTGSDVESDAEYRDRFNQVVDEALVATRPALVKALYGIKDVTKVKIFDNPTSVDTESAPAYTFHSIVIGGTPTDIAQAIYETKPINTKTHGTSSVIVMTEDGSTENIRFSYGTEIGYSVRISYSTINGVPLNDSERLAVTDAITTLAAEFALGGTVFNSQVQSSIFAAVGYTRLSNLSVALRRDGTTDFVNGNIVSPYNEIVTISPSDIYFQHSL